MTGEEEEGDKGKELQYLAEVTNIDWVGLRHLTLHSRHDFRNIASSVTEQKKVAKFITVALRR